MLHSGSTDDIDWSQIKVQDLKMIHYVRRATLNQTKHLTT